MIKVYILKTQNIQASDLGDLVTSLPFGDAEKERIFAIGSSRHRLESLCGLVALSRLCEECGIHLPLNIARTPTGKPYFPERAEVGFGISHSGGFAAAAIDTAGHSELGFDIEVIDQGYDFTGISNRFFTEDEKRLLEKKGNTAEWFFRIWTAKEARAKSDGRGLSAILGNKPVQVNDCHVWQKIIKTDDKELSIALCRKNQIRSVNIRTDGKECYEIQN